MNPTLPINANTEPSGSFEPTLNMYAKCPTSPHTLPTKTNTEHNMHAILFDLLVDSAGLQIDSQTYVSFTVFNGCILKVKMNLKIKTNCLEKLGVQLL